MKLLGPIGLAIAALFFIGIAFAEPDNIDLLKQELAAYHDSGDYAKELAEVAQEAKTYLTKRIDENKTAYSQQKLAVVFDIDETSLSSYSEMLKCRFGCGSRQFGAYLSQGKEPVIQPTLDLYRYARANGVAVFFVTGRTDSPALHQATVKNLKSAGFSDWDELYLRPLTYKESSVIPYKSGARKAIEDKGYDIVFTIGDQYSDLKGGYAEKVFKLPNPYYYIS